MIGEWRAYFPDDSETAADAITLSGVTCARDAAEQAAERDFNDRDGWERDETAFDVIVIDPEGVEYRYLCSHETTVEHVVRRIAR